jgi:hypothetical protein
MKNTIRSFWIIALFAVIGFSFAACPKGDEPYVPPYVPDVLDDTQWLAYDDDNATIILSFNRPNFELEFFPESGGSPTTTIKGKYTISGSSVTLLRSGSSSIMRGTLSGDKLRLVYDSKDLEFKKLIFTD